jgi:hypothetical protein
VSNALVENGPNEGCYNAYRQSRELIPQGLRIRRPFSLHRKPLFQLLAAQLEDHSCMAVFRQITHTREISESFQQPFAAAAAAARGCSTCIRCSQLSACDYISPRSTLFDVRSENQTRNTLSSINSRAAMHRLQ